MTELTPPETLETLHEEIVRLLTRATADRRSPYRHPALASVTAQGTPSVRTVVLRAVGERGRELTFYTDARSDKVTDLAPRPAAAVHVYDARHQVQLRLTGRVSLETDGEAVNAAWNGVPDHARAQYRTQPPPATALDTPLAYTEDLTLGCDHFTIMTFRVETIDWLSLARDGHRRAQFHWTGDTLSGTWCVP